MGADQGEGESGKVCIQCGITGTNHFGKAYYHTQLCKECNEVARNKQRLIDKKLKEEYNEALEKKVVFIIDVPSSDFHLVQTTAGLRCFEQHLQHCIMAGIDTETLPMFIKGVADKNPTALLQVAMRCQSEDVITDMVFIIDLYVLVQDSATHSLLSRLLQSLFSNENIIKLGQGLDLDIQELLDRYSSFIFGDNEVYSLASVLEISDMHDLYTTNEIQKVKVSLQRMTFDHLDMKLLKSKKLTLSNWHRRPLTPQQLQYAACDALVLLRLFDHLSTNATAGNIISEETIANLLKSFKFKNHSFRAKNVGNTRCEEKKAAASRPETTNSGSARAGGSAGNFSARKGESQKKNDTSSKKDVNVKASKPMASRKQNYQSHSKNATKGAARNDVVNRNSSSKSIRPAMDKCTFDQSGSGKPTTTSTNAPNSADSASKKNNNNVANRIGKGNSNPRANYGKNKINDTRHDNKGSNGQKKSKIN
jgi:hypothetical protein